MVTTKAPRYRKIILRKAENARAYARSISLREDQIKRIEDAGVKNMSELFQKLVDDWLLMRDKEEQAKLRERIALLWYKFRVLTGSERTSSDKEKPADVMQEINRLEEKAKEIERNIEAAEHHPTTRTAKTASP